MRSMRTLADTTSLALLLCLFALSAVAKPAHVLIVVPPGAAQPAGFADQLSTRALDPGSDGGGSLFERL